MATSAVWLSMRDKILQRATDVVGQVDSSIQVLSARDLSGVKEASQPPKSVQVYGPSYKPLDENGAGIVQVEQTWMIVVCTRNPADQKAGTAAQDDASPICDAVLQAFVGWKPGAPFSHWKLAGPPAAPMWSPGGFGYYPFSFTTRLTVKGAAN